VACQNSAEEQELAGSPKIYFDLDAGKVDDKDFFRLPFPNDLRRDTYSLDLEGFPVPPAEVTGEFGPIVDRWVDAVASNTGFALNGPTLFRASEPFVFNNDAAHPAMYLVNIDEKSDDRGKRHPIHYYGQNGTASANNYICQNWFGAQTFHGFPLDPSTTYAVFVTSSVEPAGGGSFKRDTHLNMLLNDDAPTDFGELQAWETYAYLRSFYKSEANSSGIDLSIFQTIGATVFTTSEGQTFLEHMAPITTTIPTHKALYVCDAGGDSPCSTAPGLTPEERAQRRCPTPSPNFLELHGRVEFPQFQGGTPPFTHEGGEIVHNGSRFTEQYREEVCFSLTIPREVSMPEAGWPVILYAHGTGGSFRNGVGLAEAAAVRGMAVLSFEGTLHGERRHDTDDDGLVDGLTVDELAFNLRNPDAARDNLLQGAMDLRSAVAYIKDFNSPEISKPVDLELGLDPENAFFFGHSQGAQQGVLFLGNQPTIRVAALSGGGANLLRSLTEKTMPKYRVPGSTMDLGPVEILQLALMERPDRQLTTYHPVLALLNTHVNRSDAELYAHRLIENPKASGPKSLLHYIGHVDPYTPLRTSAALAIATGLDVGGHTLFPAPCSQYDDAENSICSSMKSGYLGLVGLPLTENVPSSNGPKQTAAALMVSAAEPGGGHGVAFLPEEIERVFDFFYSALDGKTPVLNE